MTTAPPLQVRIGIPHFFRESPTGDGYGSGRPGQRLARCIALARCLHSALRLRRRSRDAVLNIAQHQIDHWPQRLQPLQRFEDVSIDLHVFTDGQHRLEEVLQLQRNRLQLHDVVLDNPRHLPLAARNWLIARQPTADLTIYMEDDLIINDPFFLDKQHWFLERTQQRMVLMPHRFEPIPAGPQARLLVDGPLRPDFIGQFCTPRRHAARGRFDPHGEEIHFDVTDNPHSGCFVLGSQQVDVLRRNNLPNDGFVGPLETAATLTVLQHFPVLKPAAPHQGFLTVEHGHPSFLGYLQSFPHQP